MARSHLATARGSILPRVGAALFHCLRRRLTVAATIVLFVGATTAASAGVVQTGLFRSHELHSDNLSAFPKWRAMLARFNQELADCSPDHCRLEEWQQLVFSLQGHNAPAQLKLVNAAINRHRYVDDWANWDLADYWETPLQFLDRSGDCEDFAIAKYLALRAAGMPAENMRIVIVNDHKRQRMHAVLAVYVRGRALILDSLYDAIVEADVIDHYEPIYSINEQGWWLHRR